MYFCFCARWVTSNTLIERTTKIIIWLLLSRVSSKHFSMRNCKFQKNKSANPKNIWPLVWKWNIIQSISLKLKESPNEYFSENCEETKTILSLKQPQNLLRLLSSNRKTPQLMQCLFSCNKNCKLCALYIKPYTSFSI